MQNLFSHISGLGYISLRKPDDEGSTVSASQEQGSYGLNVPVYRLL
jgi:hypothetical protein